MNLLENVRKELNNYISITKEEYKNQNIVIAVSCGVDSITLLHVLEDLRDEFQYRIVIAHVNHGKRKQSEIEEEYIKNYALNNNLDIEILKLNDQDFSGVNFQEEARNIRLNFFRDVLDKYKAKCLFLAHHLNDDAETIIMHLMRNSFLEGLFGIKKVSEVKGKYYLRPLLDIKKDEVYHYAKENNYIYFEDYTNQEDHYTRNQVRHNLIGETYKIDYMGEAINKYKEQMQDCNQKIITKRDEFIKGNYIDNKLNLKGFNNLEIDEKIDVLFEILKKYNLGIVNIQEIIKILNTKGNKKINYKNILIIKEYDLVIFGINNKSTNLSNENKEIIIEENGYYKIDEKHEIEVKDIKNCDFLENNSNFNILNKDIICYNHSMLPFLIRNKQDGDRLKIKNGSKKVNDILSDIKMPLSQREKVKVLIDKDGNVISILGIRKSYILNECIDKDLLIKTNFYNNL